jgi:hypothetical protein
VQKGGIITKQFQLVERDAQQFGADIYFYFIASVTLPLV